MSKSSGLGGSERSLADWLDVDRSVVNVAFNHGCLGRDPLIDMMSNPFVLGQLFTNNLNLRRLMGQNGFIEAAKCVAGFRGLNPETIDRMMFLQYHLLCRDIEIRREDDWIRPLDQSQVTAIVASMASSPAPLIPEWFSKRSREAVIQVGEAFTDLDCTAAYIRSLESEWLEIYVHTFATVEGIGCDDLWQQD
jgi:hypothetical protein